MEPFFSLSTYPMLSVLCVVLAAALLARRAYELYSLRCNTGARPENIWHWLGFGMMIAAILSLDFLLTGDNAAPQPPSAWAGEIFVIAGGALYFGRRNWRVNGLKFMFLAFMTLVLYGSITLSGQAADILGFDFGNGVLSATILWIAAFLAFTPRENRHFQKTIASFLLGITILMMPLLLERALNSDKFLESQKPRSLIIRI